MPECRFQGCRLWVTEGRQPGSPVACGGRACPGNTGRAAGDPRVGGRAAVAAAAAVVSAADGPSSGGDVPAVLTRFEASETLRRDTCTVDEAMRVAAEHPDVFATEFARPVPQWGPVGGPAELDRDAIETRFGPGVAEFAAKARMWTLDAANASFRRQLEGVPKVPAGDPDYERFRGYRNEIRERMLRYARGRLVLLRDRRSVEWEDPELDVTMRERRAGR